MATTDLMIGIGAEYKGKAAFGKANKDVLGLTAGVKTLAKAYIGLAGAQKAFRYSSQSLKAFAEDDLAAQKLSKTVENLGLAYEATNVENFIQGLEKTYHVADDLLRPAFSKLISTTQSYTKAKELMNLALNASVGAGVDLNTTVNDLTQAYVGNTRGLNKYKLGLTKAELAAKSFDELQQIITKRMAGQASQAADTYAFKLNALAIASGNAKEIIGEGIADALINAFGNGSLDQAVANMEAMARFAADFARALGTVAKYSGFALLAKGFGALDKKRNELATKDRKFDPRTGNMPDLTPAGLKIIMERKKADAAAAKRQKELAALTKKQIKLEKEKLALLKSQQALQSSSDVFNIDLIQNIAALQGQLTDDQILRLQAQQAILLGNADLAAQLSQQLLTSQIDAAILGAASPFTEWTNGAILALDAMIKLREEIGKLSVPLLTVGEQLLANDYVDVLFDAINTSFADAQNQIDALLAGLSNLAASVTTGGYVPSPNPGGGTPGTTFPDTDVPTSPLAPPPPPLPPLPPTVPSAEEYVDAIFRPGGQMGRTLSEIKITIDPSAAAYGINAAVVGANSSGASSTVNRNGSFLYGM